MTVGIITSAAYINPEMAAEFGLLPPAFLPVGNRRLFKLQAELLYRFVDRLVLSLPRSFEIPAHDQPLLAQLQIEPIFVEDELCLAQSVLASVRHCVTDDEAFYLLHGDTLFLDIEDFPAEGFSVHSGEQAYPWAMLGDGQTGCIVAIDDDSREEAALLSGLFSFSHSDDFTTCLAAADDDFLAALNAYGTLHNGFDAVADCGRWLDLGHLNTYYDSCRALTTERAFNVLSISRDAVRKSSSDHQKIDAEAHWFESLPASLKTCTPTYIGRTDRLSNHAGYSLAYEYLCPLSDLYVFGALPAVVWRRILRSCRDVLGRMRDEKPTLAEPAQHEHLYRTKALDRFSRYAARNGLCAQHSWRINDRLFPSPVSLIDQLSDYVGAPTDTDVGILHGDLCFSNILFDFRRSSIKLIDPRGYCEPGRPGIYGDTRYDLGKLHHSVFGRYDFIIAGYYSISQPAAYTLTFSVSEATRQTDIERHYREIICRGDPELERTAAAISVLLFFSMLPLHADDAQRQLAFLANAYRVYDLYFSEAA